MRIQQMLRSRFQVFLKKSEEPAVKVSSFPFSYFKSTTSAILLILGISGFLISPVVLLHHFGRIGFDELTRDPVAFLGGSAYTGFLSQVGILLWAAVSSVCIFGSYCLPKTAKSFNIKNYLLASGLITIMLGLDDTFQIHENLSTHFGISEKLVFLCYVFFICAYIFKFYRLILKTEYILLEIACLFFGISVLLDVIESPALSIYLFEDSAKLAGIVSFLIYYFRLGITRIHQFYFQISQENI
jgi:hypothetical protein